MDRKVRVQVDVLVVERSNGRVPRAERRRMASRASHLVKALLSIADRRCATRLVGRRHPGRQKSHEGGKLLNITQCIEPATIGIGGIVGRGRLLARRCLIPFRLKQFIGDAHLDIVCLARKHQERLVLRLPAKPGDCPIIAISIFTDCDCVTRIDNVELSPDPIAVAYPCCLVVDDGLIRIARSARHRMSVSES